MGRYNTQPTPCIYQRRTHQLKFFKSVVLHTTSRYPLGLHPHPGCNRHHQDRLICHWNSWGPGGVDPGLVGFLPDSFGTGLVHIGAPPHRFLAHLYTRNTVDGSEILHHLWMYPKPSKRCSKISISTGEWVYRIFWLPSNRIKIHKRHFHGSSSGQSSWGQWNLASSYLWRGEGVGKQKKHTRVGWTWTVGPSWSFFFRLDPENRVEIRREFFFRRPEHVLPEAYNFFIYMNLRRWTILGVVYLLTSFLFPPYRIRFPPSKNTASFWGPQKHRKKQGHSPETMKEGPTGGFSGQKRWLPRLFFWGGSRIILSCRPDLILFAILSQILWFFWTTRSFVMGGR